MAEYYGGMQVINDYYAGRMYLDIRNELGDVGPLWDQYHRLSGREQRNFWNANPELERYLEIKTEWQSFIFGELTRLEGSLPERDVIPVRGIQNPSLGQEALQQGIGDLSAPQTVPPEVLQNALGTSVYRQVEDLVLNNEPMDRYAQERLEEVAAGAGLPVEYIIQQVYEGLVTGNALLTQ